MKTRYFFYFLFLAILFVQCEGTLDDKSIGKELEIYLLEQYSTMENSQQIINSSAVLSQIPLVAYSDIYAYSKSKHIFYLNATLHEQFATNSTDFHTKAFAVTVDKEIIYTGYFWAAYSSSICTCISIDPIDYEESGGLKVNLGYPSDLYGSETQDLRNDTRILMLVTKDGKLIN